MTNVFYKYGVTKKILSNCCTGACSPFLIDAMKEVIRNITQMHARSRRDQMFVARVSNTIARPVGTEC